MAVNSLKIVKPGTITIDGFESFTPQSLGLKQFCGIGGGSTVTYIESDAKIIVDTGFDFESNLGEHNILANRNKLLHALEMAEVRPEEIDIVFLTHWHMDHIMNLNVFPDSEIVLSHSAVERHGLNYRGVQDGERLAEGVRVLATPGHTRDHVSLLLETEHLRYSMRTEKGGRIMGIGKVKVAVAGDAVLSPGYYITGSLWTYNGDFYSEEAARESMNKIQEQADFIIPGHGTIFQNVKRSFSQ